MSEFLGFGKATLKIEGGVCNPYDFDYASRDLFLKQFLGYTKWLKNNDKPGYEDWIVREHKILEELGYTEDGE